MRHKPLKIPKYDLPLHFAISNKLTSEVRWLIEGGTDVDARDGNKRTALMLCCLESDEFWAAGVTRMLLQAGADAALRDVNGRNALTFAVIFLKRSIVDILLRAVEYDVNQRDCDGKSALNYAILHGDISLIDTLTRACGENVLSYSDPHFNSNTKEGNIPLRQRPKTVCKMIIQSERSSARIHQSNSVMNVHKFRRGTMQDFLLKTARRRMSTSTGSRSWSSSSHRSVSLDVSSLYSRPYPTSERRRTHHTGLNQSLDPQSWRNNEQNKGWKSYVPLFWHILTEQCCPSYRPSAKPITQSFEEALGIPPKEETNEEEISTQGELTSRSAKSQIFPRRSSMPNSPSPTSETPAYQDQGRRWSEASISVSTTVTNLKAALSGSSERNVLGIVAPEFKDNPKIVKTSVKHSSKDELEKDKENISVDISPPQTPLRTTPFRRSDSFNIPKEVVKSTRTPIVRNRPGSALRQQPIRRQTTDELPIIKIDVSKAESPCDAHEKTVKSKNSGSRTSTNVAPIKLQTKTPSAKEENLNHETKKSPCPDSQTPTNVTPIKRQTKAHPAKDENPNQDRSKNSIQKRIQRRPESTLFRNRVLSDIIEENENQFSSDGQNNLTLSVSKSKMLNIRPTSAYVRGRMANGRL